MPFRLKLATAITFIVLITIIGSLFFMAFRDDDSLFEKQYGNLVNPYAFNIAAWEADTLFDQAKENITNPQPESLLTSDSVFEYFSLIGQAHTLKNNILFKNNQENQSNSENKLSAIESQIASLRPVVERTLERQIGQTLIYQGIYNPISNNWLKITLPPVNFILENPPHILIVSPKDKIERIRDTVLIQDMTLSQIQELESSLEKLNVSVLVDNLGGLGATYPSFVEADADLRFTIDTAIEEWLHQYLAFKPLGFHYVLDLLDLSRNADIPTINESVASLTSKELGGLLYSQYYSQTPTDSQPIPNCSDPAAFNFNAEMRSIRLTVEKFLALGQIDQAEKFMNDKRLYLESKGYYIRKLNQAYFAFYGSYADNPASVDPIGDDIRLLRKNSSSIKGFLDIASSLSSRQALHQAASGSN